MIKLSGSRFTDIMPENLAEQPEIQALAYAVGRQVAMELNMLKRLKDSAP